MVKPSDHWTSFQNLDRESKHAKQIEELLFNADFGYLCSRALAIRLKGHSSGAKESQHGEYTCSVDPTKFAYGTYNVALEIAFSDSVCWIARVRLPYEGEEEAQVERDMLSEIATIRLGKEKTTVPVPQIFGNDVNGTNPLGYRYILMEALPGRVLDSTFSKAVQRYIRRRSLNSLRSILISSVRCDLIRLGVCGVGQRSTDSLI